MKNLLVISSYPKKRLVHASSTVGVASYAKNTLKALKKNAEEKISLTVLAEKLTEDGSYKHDGIVVKRIWKRNSFMAFPNLLKEILNHRENKAIMLEFELAMFGNLIFLLPFPIFLIVLKLMGKKIIFVCHQILPNIEEIGPHINISHQSLRTTMLNVGLKFFYMTILMLTDKVIVFEEALKDKLSHFGNKKKIVVIPHGVEKFEKIPTKSVARRKLGIKPDEFVVLTFGYLAWYKGTDWILHAISILRQNKRISGKNVKLILAGGPNPNHTDKDYYKRYIQSINKEAGKNEVSVTGFVPEKDIALYYQASDIVVLPYRTFMSSSGPLSITFSFKKPFLLASSLKGVLQQNDIRKLMAKYRISEEKIVFKESNNDFAKTLQNLRRNTKLRKKVTLLSKDLAKSRNWDLIGGLYYEEIFA